MKAVCPNCQHEHEIDPIQENEVPAGINIRPAISLHEVERLITEYAIVRPCPARNTLIRMIRRGELEARIFEGLLGWHVYEDSFWKWAGVTPPEKATAAGA